MKREELKFEIWWLQVIRVVIGSTLGQKVILLILSVEHPVAVPRSLGGTNRSDVAVQKQGMSAMNKNTCIILQTLLDSKN